MLEVVVFIGLQAAGKSTFYAQRFSQTHVLVSKDRLRNNRRPERRQQRLITEALEASRSVVVDNTNPSRLDRASIIATARSFDAHIRGYFFASPLAECLVRNAFRPSSTRVPDVGLFSTVKKLAPPSFSEGFDELWTVQTIPHFQFDIAPYPETPDESR